MRTSSSTGDFKENVWKVDTCHPRESGDPLRSLDSRLRGNDIYFIIPCLFACLLLLFSCAKRPAYKHIPKKAPSAKVEHERAPETGAKKEIIRTEPSPPPVMATPQARASAKLLDDGRQKMSLGEFDPAKRSFQEAINIDPSNGIAYYYLARAKFELGEYQQALGVLDKAEALLSGSAEWTETVQTLKGLIQGSVR